MTPAHPKRWILAGFALLLVGVILPFLMVLRVVDPTFLLSFISYAASVGGLIIGTIGVISYARVSRKR